MVPAELFRNFLNNLRTLFGTKSIEVRWAAHTLAATIENVRVNHRCPHIAVTEKFLHGADIVAIGQQVRRERKSSAGPAAR